MFWSKKFWSKIFLVKKNYWSKKILSKNVLVKRIFGQKILLVNKILVIKNCWSEKIFGRIKNFGLKIFFCAKKIQNHVSPKKNSSKKILAQKNFGSKKFCSKKFLGLIDVFGPISIFGPKKLLVRQNFVKKNFSGP